MKRIKYAVMAAIFLLISPLLFSCSSQTVEWDNYQSDRIRYNAEEFLPADLASYDNLYYDHDKKILLWFVTDTMTLQIKYPEDFYNSEKEILDEEYDFLTEPVESDWQDGRYTVPLTEFDCNGFRFRVAAGGEYPKEFGMIGYNDETREIAYLWFHDPDYDFIGDEETSPEQSMREFVENHFKLK